MEYSRCECEYLSIIYLCTKNVLKNRQTGHCRTYRRFTTLRAFIPRCCDCEYMPHMLFFILCSSFLLVLNSFCSTAQCRSTCIVHTKSYDIEQKISYSRIALLTNTYTHTHRWMSDELKKKQRTRIQEEKCATNPTKMACCRCCYYYNFYGCCYCHTPPYVIKGYRLVCVVCIVYFQSLSKYSCVWKPQHAKQSRSLEVVNESFYCCGRGSTNWIIAWKAEWHRIGVRQSEENFNKTKFKTHALWPTLTHTNHSKIVNSHNRAEIRVYFRVSSACVSNLYFPFFIISRWRIDFRFAFSRSKYQPKSDT